MRSIAEKVYYYLLPIALLVSTVAVHLAGKHIAFTNISLGVLTGLVVLKYVFKKAYQQNVPIDISVSILLSYVVFSLGVFISNSNYEETYFSVKRWLVWPQILLIFYLLPIQKRHTYLGMLGVFVAFLFFVDLYVFYKYIHLIVINKGSDLPSESWVNFIDLMRSYIIPFRYYHHFLAFMNIFGLGVVWFLSKKSNISKLVWLFVGCVYIAAIHFLAARMAIFTFYVICLFCIYFYGLKKLKYGMLVGAISALIFAVVLSVFVNLIPTLNLKYAKLKEEISFYKSSSYEQILNGPDYRLKGYFNGIEVLKDNLWVGVGLNNIGKTFSGTTWPLNNYLYLAVALGLPVAILLFLCHFYPAVRARNTDTGKLILLFYGTHFFYSFTDTSLMLRDSLLFFCFWSVALQHLDFVFEKTN